MEKTRASRTLTVMPFLLALFVGVFAMPTNVVAVNAYEMGHEHAQPWRSRTVLGPVRHGLATLTRTLAKAVDRLRGSPALTPAICAAALGCIALAVPHAHLGAVLLMGTVATPPAAGASARELREQREKLIRDAGALMGANNTFENDDKRSQFDKIMKDVDALAPRLEDAERTERLDAASRSSMPESQRPGAPARDAKKGDPVYERALDKVLRGARSHSFTVEEMQALDRGRADLSGAEFRDMSTLSGSVGGYTVPPDNRFYGQVVQALKFFGGVEAAGAEIIETDNGQTLPIPTSDDTANTGAIVAEEGSHATGTAPTFGQKNFGAYMFSSLIIKVSWQYLQDSAIDVQAWLGGRIGERIGRAMNTYFTTGTGSSQPQGVVVGASVGRQAAVGNTTTFPFDDVFRTVHSVDVAYRTERCRWMMHDQTALALRLAKDGQGRYLWPEMGNVQNGQPPSLAGYTVVVNNDVAQMAASAKAATFGDHSYYKIRRVRALTIVRLDELYAANGQVGFLAFMRADGGLVDAGQKPVKYFQNSAT